MTATEEASRGLWAKCVSCAHCWIVAYYPMEAAKFAVIMKANGKACPKCGARRPVVAKQKDGVLQEPTA